MSWAKDEVSKAKNAAGSKRWREANRERHLASKAEYRRRVGPAQHRAWQLKAKFGLTVEEYDCMLSAQSGVCAICRSPETMTLRGKLKTLAVDHDHVTGKVRGLLCHACNAALGHMRDNPSTLREAALYLESDPCPR